MSYDFLKIDKTGLINNFYIDIPFYDESGNVVAFERNFQTLYSGSNNSNRPIILNGFDNRPINPNERIVGRISRSSGMSSILYRSIEAEVERNIATGYITPYDNLQNEVSKIRVVFLDIITNAFAPLINAIKWINNKLSKVIEEDYVYVPAVDKTEKIIL